MTRLYTHEIFLAHDTGPHHPERPDRLRAVLKALEAPAFADLERHAAPLATRDQIERVHPPAQVEGVLGTILDSGLAQIDGDTVVSPKSGDAAFHAAGALCAAVDAVASGAARNAFCAVRPPGHHAEPSRAMGFCLFNSVAIGAMQARVVHGLERVAVVDFDVHHGNGTQAFAWEDRDFFYASTHQMPLYPGSGRPAEKGVGNIVNAPLQPGADGVAFRAVMNETVLPALRRFAPDIVLISAGFDGHARDPLANLNLVEDDYAWVTRALMAVAAESAEGRVVSCLEGGYDLEALAASAAAHVAALMAE
ncbi:MAG: histone deacetylase family protein [Alphaproteobacteria bacterium]|nr:histone deacetylase family protein [Alphaproteobacteria bacterium]